MATKSKNVEYALIDVAKLILKAEDIHDGYWMIQVQFLMGAGNVGHDPSKPDQVNPTALIGVNTIGLKKVDELGPLVIDASKLETD